MRPRREHTIQIICWNYSGRAVTTNGGEFNLDIFIFGIDQCSFVVPLAWNASGGRSPKQREGQTSLKHTFVGGAPWIKFWRNHPFPPVSSLFLHLLSFSCRSHNLSHSCRRICIERQDSLATSERSRRHRREVGLRDSQEGVGEPQKRPKAQDKKEE